MKVAIASCSDINGGAARAAYRLHQSLRLKGVDSHMVVQQKSSDDFTVKAKTSKVAKGMAMIRPSLDALPLIKYKNRTNTDFSLSWLPFSGTLEKINRLNPDVVHLHWVAGGLLRVEDIAHIKAPLVWSLHDMWPFTGGCHYDGECGRYRTGCAACPILLSSRKRDLSAKVFVRKQKNFNKLESLTVVGLSRWIQAAAQASLLFSDRRVINIPNPINTKIFAPFDKVTAKNLLRLPQNKKIIVCGAMDASQPRKGLKEFLQALNLVDTDLVEVVVFGRSRPKEQQGFLQNVHYVGRLHDDVTFRILYSAADVVVVPSIQENLSNVVMESLACGTPVVGFDIGGNRDMIEHKKNGYLAKPYDVKDLAVGINFVVNSSDYPQLAEESRNKVLREFDSSVVALKYIELYQSIL